MNISFSDVISVSSCFNFISNQLSALTLKQRVGLVALTILGSVSAYYFLCYRFQAQHINRQEEDLESELPVSKNKKENSFLSEQSQKVQEVSRGIQKKEEPLKKGISDWESTSILSENLLRNEAELTSLPPQSDSSIPVKINQESKESGKKPEPKKSDEPKQLKIQKEEIQPIPPYKGKTDAKDPLTSQFVPPQDEKVIDNSPSKERSKPALDPFPYSQSLPTTIRPKKDEEKDQDKGARSRTTSLYSPGKLKAIGIYRQDPWKCGKIQKNILFREIKHIETPIPTTDLSSVVDLMLFVSELNEVDLAHLLCKQVVLDTFKACNKETSEQLCGWLGKQPTFNPLLLKESLAVLIDMYQQQQPVNLYSFEQLLRIYMNREWNLARDEAKQLILPSNQDVLMTSMEILIYNQPNENRITALAEWFMNQPEYTPQVFEKWVKIFQKKEWERGGRILHYPLLDKLIEDFSKKWGDSRLSELDSSVVSYLKQRNLVPSGV